MIEKIKNNKKIVIVLEIFLLVIILIIIYLLFFSNDSYTGNYKDGVITIITDNSYKYQNEDGEVIFSGKYDNEKINIIDMEYVDGLAPYIEDNKYGLIDYLGEIKIKNKYDNIKIFSNDLILVRKKSEMYFINNDGKKKFSGSYFDILYENDIQNTNNELVFVVISHEGKYGVIDQNGNQILKNEYDNLRKIYDTTRNGFIFFGKLNQYNKLYNSIGEEIVIDDNIDDIFWYDDSKICYRDKNLNIYIYDMETKEIINYGNKYDGISEFVDGVSIAIDKNRKVGYIDEDNNIIIDFIYEMENSMSNFENGRAIVSKKIDGNYKSGMLDIKGNVLIDFIYDSIGKGNIDNNYIVNLNDKFFVIDELNNKLTNEYDVVYSDNNLEYYVVGNKIGKNLKYGLLDNSFNVVCEIVYDKIILGDDGLILLDENNKYVLINN